MWQNNVVNNNPIEYTMSVEKLPAIEFIKSFQYIPKYNIRATCTEIYGSKYLPCRNYGQRIGMPYNKECTVEASGDYHIISMFQIKERGKNGSKYTVNSYWHLKHKCQIPYFLVSK